MFTIYKLECIPNGKCYVGRTSRNYVYRLKAHFKVLRAGKHSNKGLQHDYDLYGASAFAASVLETITGDTDGGAERRWMLRLKTNQAEYGYNGCDPNFGNKRKTNHANFGQKSEGLPGDFDINDSQTVNCSGEHEGGD